MSATQSIVVLITAPDQEEAARLAVALVEEKLAACANIVPAIRSIYRWKGKVRDEAEALIIVKSRRELFGALSARVRELHSYSVPEVIALPIVEGSHDYLKWLEDETS